MARWQQPPDLGQRCKQQQETTPHVPACLCRAKYPQQQGQCRERQRGALHRCAHPERQPRCRVHGERRDHTAGDHAFDHHDQGQRCIQRCQRRHIQNPDQTQVKNTVGEGQQHQHRGQRQVAPVARAQQQAREHRRYQGQQGQVQHGVQGVGPCHGRHPRREPQQRQGAQGSAAGRGQASPGFDRSQQKAQDDRHRKAEQHFVRMPQQRWQRHGEVPMAQVHGHPQRNGEQGKRRGAHIEGPEPQPQQWPA